MNEDNTGGNDGGIGPGQGRRRRRRPRRRPRGPRGPGGPFDGNGNAGGSPPWHAQPAPSENGGFAAVGPDAAATPAFEAPGGPGDGNGANGGDPRAAGHGRPDGE